MEEADESVSFFLNSSNAEVSFLSISENELNLITSTPAKRKYQPKAPAPRRLLAQKRVLPAVLTTVACTTCGSRFKRIQALKVHLRTHMLKDNQRLTEDVEAFMVECSNIATKVLKKIAHPAEEDPQLHEEVVVACQLLDNLDSEQWTGVVNTYVEVFTSALQCKPFFFPAELRTVLNVATNALLNNVSEKVALISLVREVVHDCSERVAGIFIGEFGLEFANEALLWFLRRFRNNLPNGTASCLGGVTTPLNTPAKHIRHMQAVHYVAGSTVRAYLRLGFRLKNSKWQSIADTMQGTFLEGPGVVSVDDVTKVYTMALNKGGLSIVGKSAFEFFFGLSNVLSKVQERCGSVAHDKMLSEVVETPGLLHTWDVLLGVHFQKAYRLISWRLCASTLPPHG